MVRLTRIFRCVRGATAIEYALVASLIAVAAVGAFHTLGNNLNNTYQNVSNNLK
ncbi:MAG TPA: Flp family type IVb pilin [Sphingomicrobium sp.]|jgi:pilus assembly protein Flp/PilA